MSGLHSYSVEELAGEIARRASNAPKREFKFRACDKCQHFEAWTSDIQGPINEYNPCAHQHRLAFREPESPSDREWGFYRRTCPDRTPTPRAQRDSED